MEIAYDRDKVNEFVECAIRNRGVTKEKYNQIRIAPVDSVIIDEVKKASLGKLDLSGKYWALEAGSIYHEYMRHSDFNKELSRGQIPMTVKDWKCLAEKIINPDIIEYISPPTKYDQRHRLALISKDEGYVVVVEQVGGIRNPNIVPPMVLHINQNKMKDVISGKKSISDLIYENSTNLMPSEEQRKENLKNRVDCSKEWGETVDEMEVNESKCVKVWMGNKEVEIPIEDYLDIVAQQNGFDDYEEMQASITYISIIIINIIRVQILYFL